MPTDIQCSRMGFSVGSYKVAYRQTVFQYGYRVGKYKVAYRRTLVSERCYRAGDIKLPTDMQCSKTG